MHITLITVASGHFSFSVLCSVCSRKQNKYISMSCRYEIITVMNMYIFVGPAYLTVYV